MEPTEAANWEMVVYLIQTDLREEKLAEESTWQTVIMIPRKKMD